MLIFGNISLSTFNLPYVNIDFIHTGCDTNNYKDEETAAVADLDKFGWSPNQFRGYAMISSATLSFLQSANISPDAVAPSQLCQLESLVREFAHNGFFLSVSTEIEYTDLDEYYSSFNLLARCDGSFRFGKGWQDQPEYAADACAMSNSVDADNAEILIESLVGLIGDVYEYRAAVIARHYDRKLDIGVAL